MKKITLLLLIIAISLPNFLAAQDKNSPVLSGCITDEYNESLLENNPNMMGSESFRLNLEAKIALLIKDAPLNERGGAVVTIPVVVHVLHNGEAVGVGPNITFAQAESQITVMNQDFRRMAGTPGWNTHADGADVEVEFCLVQQDPDGGATNGVDRVNIGQDGVDSMAAMNAQKALTFWDASRYMNMWSSKYVGGFTNVLGYAQFPGGPANTDGVSANYTTFGSSDFGTFPLGAPYDKGRTMTHEVGHFLGLYHTFQGGCGAPGDEVADTPAVDNPNFGCPGGHVSCGTTDMIENYMDYTDDTCMNIYTNGQKTRVVGVLATATNRASLTTSDACEPAVIFDLDGRLDIEDLNVVDCGTSTMTPDVRLTNAGNNTLTSATISYYLDGDTPTDYPWTGSLAIDEFEIISFPEIMTTTGAHTFYAELSEPNGGTDMNPANDNANASYTYTGALCASVANTDYLTSTEGVIINDGTTDILSNLNTGKPSGYSDYTGIVTDLARAESYDLSVYANSDGNYQIITYVWIDWNQNCSFDDAGEEYDLGQSADIVNDLTVNSPLSITVPAGAELGNTIMRVTTKYTNPGANQFPTSCENDHDAEVEDYTINVLAALSVDEFGLNSISIYPNPASNVLNIALSNSDLPDGYRVYNMLGQTLSNKVISTISDLSVNTANLSNGMYFIEITREGNSVSLPFIKQ